MNDWKSQVGRIGPGLLCLMGFLVGPASPAQQTNGPTPLLQAHSHNDYEHARPLFDALDRGFCSVEADVWLVDGKLLVGHDRGDLKPERTLESLYLNPLRTRIKQNGGRVFQGGPTLILLVDVKSDATNTYLALRGTFRKFSEILTRFQPERTETNAVTVIISGNRARELMAGENVRLAAYDGRVGDLDSGAPPEFIPLISDNWATLFRWKGTPGDGSMPAAERQKLNDLAQRAHRQGRRLRLWGAPDQPEAWAVLLDAGVDFVNADDLERLQKFLSARAGSSPWFLRR
jgi:hypothetical protein